MKSWTVYARLYYKIDSHEIPMRISIHQLLSALLRKTYYETNDNLNLYKPLRENVLLLSDIIQLTIKTSLIIALYSMLASTTKTITTKKLGLSLVSYYDYLSPDLIILIYTVVWLLSLHTHYKLISFIQWNFSNNKNIASFDKHTYNYNKQTKTFKNIQILSVHSSKIECVDGVIYNRHYMQAFMSFISDD